MFFRAPFRTNGAGQSCFFKWNSLATKKASSNPGAFDSPFNTIDSFSVAGGIMMMDSGIDVVTVAPGSTLDHTPAAIDDPGLSELDRLAASLDALALSFHKPGADKVWACTVNEPLGERA